MWRTIAAIALAHGLFFAEYLPLFGVAEAAARLRTAGARDPEIRAVPVQANAFSGIERGGDVIPVIERERLFRARLDPPAANGDMKPEVAVGIDGERIASFPD